MLVVRRIDLQFSGPSIADNERVGLGTLFDNDSATFDRHGGTDLRSSSNMSAKPNLNAKTALAGGESGQLFYSNQIQTCLSLLSRDKRKGGPRNARPNP